MDLQGKRIAFLGDSITEGYGASGEDKTYWYLLGEMTGAEVFGYGIGGTTIARRQRPLETPSVNRYFGSRIEEMIPDADVVVIFGGTNDFGGSDPTLGRMTDRTEDTFYGAYHCLIQKLMARYPDGKIVIATPLHRTTEDDDFYNEQDGRRDGTLLRYVQAIREVAQYYGLTVADLYRNCPMQPRMPGHQQRYMPDGLHPNDAGHVLIAQRLLAVLRRL